MSNTILLSVIMPNIVPLDAIMLNVVLLNVMMINGPELLANITLVFMPHIVECIVSDHQMKHPFTSNQFIAMIPSNQNIRVFM